jgi:hypothetical protein
VSSALRFDADVATIAGQACRVAASSSTRRLRAATGSAIHRINPASLLKDAAWQASKHTRQPAHTQDCYTC